MAAQGVALKRIISGGQTGADQGGLLAARDLGISTGGTAPKQWLTETGSAEQLLRSFGLSECAEPGYDARTRRNVLDADGTVLFGSHSTGGSALTAEVAKQSEKPFFHVPFPISDNETAFQTPPAEFREWLRLFQIRVLNVAGNRESQNPGVQEFTRMFLTSSLRPDMP